jgi:hypothetical protein
LLLPLAFPEPGEKAKESRRKGLKQTRGTTTLQPSSPFPEAGTPLIPFCIFLSNWIVTRAMRR